jgi:plastocyanin
MRVTHRSMRRPRSAASRVALAMLPLLAATPLFLAACGGDDDDGGGSSGETVTATDGRVSVDAQDTKYNVDTIDATAGALDVTLLQKGSLDHTFVVEDADGEKVGERLTVTSSTEEARGSFDLTAGDYDFYCDIPGHRGQGMEGTIVVE